jgi:hypothetical protein
VLPGSHVSAAPCCLPSHTQPLPTGPCYRPIPPVSRSRPRHSCPAALHCRAATPSPAPIAPFVLPIPTLHAAPRHPLSSHSLPPCSAHPWTPCLPLFPLCRAPKCGQKPPAAVPLSSSLHSFAPVLKHAATSPILPRVSSLASDARASLLPPVFPRDAAAVRLHW